VAFKKGHPKYGGRKPGGSKAQLDLKAAILGALQALNPHEYLTQVARNDPRTFCTLLGRVLPMTLVGNPANPIRYKVRLAFGNEEHTIPLPLRPALANDTNAPSTEHKTLEAEAVEVEAEAEPTKLH
jgi:hypothetical protein